MGMVTKLIGPASKYERDIPYTYEARIKFLDSGEEYSSYIADTICALVEHLVCSAISPEEVELYEIFREEEKPLDLTLCLSAQGQWLQREQLCESFRTHYPGHIHTGGCTFEDRERDVSGP